MFHYSLKTPDPAEFLEKLLDLLEREHLHLEDFEVKDLAEHEHQVRLSVIASLDGNRRLLRGLRQLGSKLQSSTHEHAD